jgi:hypothetical protein
MIASERCALDWLLVTVGICCLYGVYFIMFTSHHLWCDVLFHSS